MPLENQKRIAETEVLRHIAREWKINGLRGWTEYQTNFTTSICQWDGIYCNEEFNTLVKIELPRLGLTGTISAEFSVLSDLEIIDFSENLLTGTIPLELKRMPALKVINVAFNKIHGAIDGFLPSIKMLNASHNEINTMLPNFGLTSTMMEIFDISYNRLGGEIPSSMGAMEMVRHLDLSFNQFTGTIPHSFGDMHDLKGLFLNDNRLMGTIPHTLLAESSGASFQKELEYLHLHHNDLSGTIPEDLSSHVQLKELFIDGNKFTGEIPSEICNMNLNGFPDMYDGGLEGSNGCNTVACPVNTVSPNGMFPCKHCGENEFSPYLGRDKNCFTLNEEEILQTLYSKTNGPMWKNNTGWNDRNSSVCEYFGVRCNDDGNVVAIELSDNGLIGEIPELLGMLSYLEYLDLSSNKLVGTLPSDLRFAPLQVLDVSSNRLEGHVAPMLCMKDEINGNGVGGTFDCDLISCPPGTYSPIGRATSKVIAQENGQSNIQCQPCNRSTSRFLGAKHCGTIRLDRDEIAIGDFFSYESNLMLALIVLCSFIAILAAVIIYRTRKVRQNHLLHIQNARRELGGYDTESCCTDVTESQHALRIKVRKLQADDDHTFCNEDDHSYAFSQSCSSRRLDGLELATLNEYEDETNSMISTNSRTSSLMRGSTASFTGRSISSDIGSTSVRSRSSELWLNAPNL